MSIRIFISSTREDLEKDCIKTVKRGFKNRAVAVEMTEWDTDFKDPVEVCREKIEKESSHYIGVFAYRRGWSPDKLNGKSITEAEFDWAREYNKIQAVFIPVINSEFA